MRFQRKIMLLYVIFGLFTAILLGGGYYTISVQQNLKNEYQNLSTLAKQYEQQWNEYIKPMDSIMSYILSDQEMLESLRVLAGTPLDTQKNINRRKEAAAILTQRITSDYTINSFYRVALFNSLGGITASNDYGDTMIQKNKDVKTIPWLSKVNNTKGKNILIGRHLDDWGIKDNPEVFSIVKEIQGTDMGFIEVQKRIDELDKMFQVADEKILLLIIDSEGEVLYSSQSYDQMGFYCNYAGAAEKDIDTIFNSVSGEKEVISVQKSRDNRVTILVSCELAYIQGKSFYIIPITVLLAGGFFAFSFIYTWLSSKRLARPIQQLKEFMDNTKLENIQEKREIAVTNDEIEILSHSYKDVLERLNLSIKREKRMSFLQLQAQYDLLQAQINPHFIYNVLNVISNRGIENEDDDICELCDSLAQMLRYSTGTKKRYVTIKEELQYVNQYFYLLHSRYEYRLQYEVNVKEEILNQILPKIVLQQIVENAISHGYENTSRNMYISVTGGKRGDRWYLEICDNGNGFSEDSLKEQRRKIEEIKQKLIQEQDSIELEIGGMGLVNTYARLFLVYREDLEFRLENMPSGACVIIEASMRDEI